MFQTSPFEIALKTIGGTFYCRPYVGTVCADYVVTKNMNEIAHAIVVCCKIII